MTLESVSRSLADFSLAGQSLSLLSNATMFYSRAHANKELRVESWVARWCFRALEGSEARHLILGQSKGANGAEWLYGIAPLEPPPCSGRAVALKRWACALERAAFEAVDVVRPASLLLTELLF